VGRRGSGAPHLRAASSWQHHYRYQVITPSAINANKRKAISWDAQRRTLPASLSIAALLSSKQSGITLFDKEI
jgi:hypothetical protein